MIPALVQSAVRGAVSSEEHLSAKISERLFENPMSDNRRIQQPDENSQGDSAEESPMANSSYTPDDLQHLSDMEHVRKRPAMYIGDITGRGLHHLVYEVVDNSIDEAMAGFAKNIKLSSHKFDSGYLVHSMMVRAQ